jgi:PIN domain nuclease of toxin-antitoxin system
MKYLLDTHTYLWYRSSPQALPAAVISLLTDASQEMLISVATPWELAIKTGIGKLDAASLLVDFESRETAAGFHRDPFDRLLAAQALELGIPIVSRDRVFDLYGVQRIWD